MITKRAVLGVFAAIAVLAPAVVAAQTTTVTLRGVVHGPGGVPVAVP